MGWWVGYCVCGDWAGRGGEDERCWGMIWVVWFALLIQPVGEGEVLLSSSSWEVGAFLLRLRASGEDQGAGIQMRAVNLCDACSYML